MKLRYIIFILFLSLLSTSCTKENEPIQPTDTIKDCLVDEFYARMLINGKCWTSTFAYFGIQDSIPHIWMETDVNYEENFLLRFNDLRLNHKSNFKGDRNSKIYLFVTAGYDAHLTSYEPRYSSGKELNWVLIDSINSDSTIIKGKFEAVLYRENAPGIESVYPRPEKLVITDGQFKVERLDID